MAYDNSHVWVVYNVLTAAQMQQISDNMTVVYNGMGQWLIEDKLLSGAAASFDFTGIPATYKHLQLVLYIRSNKAAQNYDGALLTFNNDSAANYDFTYSGFHHNLVYLTGEGIGATNIPVAFGLPAATSTANYFADVIIDIPNYAQTVGYKIVSSINDYINDIGSTHFGRYMTLGFWRSTAAINRITIPTQYAAQWIIGSRATLYGRG